MTNPEKEICNYVNDQFQERELNYATKIRRRTKQRHKQFP